MDRNYFIGTPESGGTGGSKFDVMAFLPGLLGGNKGIDPNLAAMLTQQRRLGWRSFLDLDHLVILPFRRLG